jgi:hypothetical protein
MEGYTNLKQYVEDYGLYMIAEDAETVERKGETLRGFLKKRMRSRLKNASKGFKRELARNNFKERDIGLLAEHDMTGRTIDIEEVLQNFIWMQGKTPQEKLRLIIKSRAFQSGRLHKITSLVPSKLDCKEDLVDFIKSNPSISHSFICSMCTIYTRKNWKKWLAEASVEGVITRTRRGWS